MDDTFSNHTWWQPEPEKSSKFTGREKSQYHFLIIQIIVTEIIINDN